LYNVEAQPIRTFTPKMLVKVVFGDSRASVFQILSLNAIARQIL